MNQRMGWCGGGDGVGVGMVWGRDGGVTSECVQ